MLLLFWVVCWFLRQPHLQTEESRAGELVPSRPILSHSTGLKRGCADPCRLLCWHVSVGAVGKGCPASPPALPRSSSCRGLRCY